MNIFDLSFVEVTKIINAKKLVFKTGARSSSKEWRNKYDGNEHGYYSLSFTIGGEAEYHIGKKRSYHMKTVLCSWITTLHSTIRSSKTTNFT